MTATVLLVIALVLLLLEGLKVPPLPRFAYGWLGLAFLAAASLGTALKLP